MDEYTSGLIDVGAAYPLARMFGRSVARRARLDPRQFGQQRLQVLARPNLIQPTPGVAGASLKHGQPFALVAATMGVGATTGQLAGRPQVPIRAAKLTMAVYRTGAGVANALVTLVSGFNGIKNILPGLNPVDISGFSALAQGLITEFDGSGPGIDLTLNVASNVAPAAGESIVVTATLWVDAIT